MQYRVVWNVVLAVVVRVFVEIVHVHIASISTLAAALFTGFSPASVGFRQVASSWRGGGRRKINSFIACSLCGYK